MNGTLGQKRRIVAGNALRGRVARLRRALAGAGAALLLGFQALSAWMVAHEAEHECSGDECPVCSEVQQCVANFQLTGPGLEADATTVSLPTIAADSAVPAEVVLPDRTLVALKVRMDE